MKRIYQTYIMTSKTIPANSRLNYSTSASPRSVDLDCGSRREVGRSDIKNEVPESNDLYGLVGKYPTVEDLKEILVEAVKGPNGIPALRARFRNGTKAYDKAELVSRVLVYPKTRQMALDLLIELNHVDESAELGDFYLQFCHNGPIFDGTEPESVALQESAMISVIEREVEEVPVQTFLRPAKFSPELSNAVLEAVAESDGKEIDPKRSEAVASLLRLVADMDVKDINLLSDEITQRLGY